MFYRVQVRALVGPLKDIRRIVPKPLLCCQGRCPVRWTFTPVLGPECSGAGFIRLSVLYPFIFASILTSLPVPSAEKHPHSRMLTPPCFTVGMVPGFLQKWRLAFRPFLMVWESLGAFRETPSRLSCAFYWGVASVWPLYHKGLIGGLLQRWLSFWKVLPSPQRNSGALSEWPSGSWSPHWPRPFSPDCSVWLGGQL